MDMHNAVRRVQSRDLPEGLNHPECTHDDYWALLMNLRQAVARQILTPAADQRDVEWKRRALASGQFEYVDLSKERAQRAIDADVAFLAEHPTRRTGRKVPS